jgi:hypothetical protein
LLTAVVGDYAARHHIAPNVVATGNELKLLVRCRWRGVPLPADSLLGQGWRAEHVLPELRAVLEGRKSIRVDDVHRDAPLSYRSQESGVRSQELPAPMTFDRCLSTFFTVPRPQIAARAAADRFRRG